MVGTCGRAICLGQSKFLHIMVKTLLLSILLLSGCITSMVLDSTNQTWLVVGTSRGVFSCWDIRFQLMVRSWSYPSKSSIIKMLNFKNSDHGQTILASAGKNEMSVWDITSGECKELFCARPIDEKVGKFAKSFRVPFTLFLSFFRIFRLVILPIVR